jgi:hypothetical protein
MLAEEEMYMSVIIVYASSLCCHLVVQSQKFIYPKVVLVFADILKDKGLAS